jgi:hypothetical protein
MTEPFFTITQHPDAWQHERGMSHRVVNMTPWQHDRFSIRGQQVIGRKAWNAPEPEWKNEVIYYNLLRMPLRNLLTNIVVHHTDNWHTVYTNEVNQRSRGFAALGYHFFIDIRGIVYEGRPLEIMGSHAGEGVISGPRRMWPARCL